MNRQSGITVILAIFNEKLKREAKEDLLARLKQLIAHRDIGKIEKELGQIVINMYTRIL